MLRSRFRMAVPARSHGVAAGEMTAEGLDLPWFEKTRPFVLKLLASCAGWDFSRRRLRSPSTLEDYAGRNRGNGIDLPEIGSVRSPSRFSSGFGTRADAKQMVWAFARLRPELRVKRGAKAELLRV